MSVPKHFRIAVFYILTLISNTTYSQNTLDYSKIFGDKYTDALEYIQGNQWISDSVNRYGINPLLAKAIIFPELIRYSALRDFIETYSLEVLYVQYGAKYADFSIGRFQIKPSFANRLEKDWNEHLRRAIPTATDFAPFDTTDNTNNRISRLQRLKNDWWQAKYLIMFIKLNEHRQNWGKNELKEEAHFLASAYNVGYWYNHDQIIRIGKLQSFHSSLFKPEVCYNFADIALDYYQKQMPK